jgi:hypothetical protein
MSAIVIDPSGDLPQSAEPCTSCLYKSAPAWTSSVLAPGAQEELYDGRDIHVETHLRGLAEGEEGGTRMAVEAATGGYVRSIFTFLVVTAAVSYAARGVFYGQWGMVDWGTGPFFRTDVVVPAVVGATVATVMTAPSRT